MRFWKRKSDPDDEIVLTGDWTNDIWDGSPIRVPATLDADAFLSQRPVPPIYPGDAGFLSYAAGDEGMRRLWVIVLLHHPDPDVVAAVLRSKYLGNVVGHSVTLADLLLDGRATDAAAEAVWRMSDEAVHAVLNVVLNRGAVPGWHSPQQGVRALAVLRSTCPADRRAFLEADIDG
jgi:hypothetical protein